MTGKENKVLYIEGSPSERKVVAHVARESNYPFDLIMASTFKESVDHLKKDSFQTVVSNFRLTDGQATDLVPLLGSTPLIIIYDEGIEENTEKILKNRAHEFLFKDRNLNYLKILPIKVARCAEHKKQYDELERYRSRLEILVQERTAELTDMFLQLQESEANFRDIFNNTSDGIIITDYDFNFLEANNTLLSSFGLTREYLASQELIHFLAPAYHGLIFNRLQELKQGIASGDLEIEIVAPLTGELIAYEINNVPIIFNQKKAILTVMRNITERKSLARKLFETIIQTEEEERLRIARDLHDELGPLISALKIYTTTFMESTSKEKKNKLAGQIGFIMRDVIESIKELSNDMSPHVLVNFGLLAAIRNIIELFSKGLKIQLQSNLEDMRFPSTVESVIYRILKELINNTVKHAHAQNIDIHLDFANGSLVCNYRDDGTGFDWQAYLQSKIKGMGISNITSRIQSLGGEMEIITSPGKGFMTNLVIKTSPYDGNT